MTSPRTPDQDHAIRDAFASTRGSLRAAPAFLIAAALAAGMAPDKAHAWGNDFENLGRVIGGEVGRQAGNDRYGAQARIGGLLGEVIGSRAGRPADEADREAKRIADIERQAREQAVRDAAYEAQRRRIDPNYRSMSASSNASNVDYGRIGANFDRLSAQHGQERSFPRQR